MERLQCGAYKPPMTNADRIRAMSDEELAEFLERETYDSLEHRARWWLDWLREPAKDGDE